MAEPATAATTTATSTIKVSKELTIWGKAWWVFKKIFKALVILLFIWLFYLVAVLTGITSMNSFICLFTLPVYASKVDKSMHEIETAINALNIRLGALDNKKMDLLQLPNLNLSEADLGINDTAKQSFQSSRKSNFTPNAYMNELQRFKSMGQNEQQEYLKMSQEDKRKKYQS
jgi:hypothetical protein